MLDSAPPPRGPEAVPLASAAGLQITRLVCTAGPRDRPCCEQHGGISSRGSGEKHER